MILVGHDHDYERFAPLAPTGAIDTARGIREIVVGTGGRTHYGFGSPITGSEVRNGTAFGVLKVTLKANSYCDGRGVRTTANHVAARVL